MHKALHIRVDVDWVMCQKKKKEKEKKKKAQELISSFQDSVKLST